MSFLSHVVAFFTTGSNWTGSSGIVALSLEQAKLSVVAVVAAIIAGVGAGALLGHSGRGSFAVVNAANAARAVPSFALLTLIAIQPAIVRLQECCFLTAVISMFA